VDDGGALASDFAADKKQVLCADCHGRMPFAVELLSISISPRFTKSVSAQPRGSIGSIHTCVCFLCSAGQCPSVERIRFPSNGGSQRLRQMGLADCSIEFATVPLTPMPLIRFTTIASHDD
jgi:hypothetical protein